MIPGHLEPILNRWLSPLGRDLPDCCVVGGAVRDSLLGRPPRDVDIVCAEAAALAGRAAAGQTPPAALVDLSRKRHTPCFRLINRKRPDDFIDILEINGPNLEADLRQRDFSINAMARPVHAGGRPGPLIDPLKGNDDLRARLIRYVSPQALRHDPLRVLRGVRLAAELEFTIEPETLRSMKKNAVNLSRTACERIQGELLTILANRAGARYIRLLDEIGALEVIIPEIIPMKGCRQNDWHHLDVWNHCLETLRHCEALLNRPEELFGRTAPAVMASLPPAHGLPLLKLAALLHDIAKPVTRQFRPDKNKTIFHGHARAGRDMIAVVADRLRLSAADKNFLTRLVGHHMRPLALSRPEALEKTTIKWFRAVDTDGLAVIMLAAADMAAKAGRKTNPADGDRLRRWAARTAADYLHSLKKTLAAESLVSGHDLAAMGMKPGPEMGRVLAALRDRQDQGRLVTREEALDLAEKILREKSAGDNSGDKATT